MCLYPRLIRNRKYLPNKKNGGNPPPIYDKRTTFVPIACQHCLECRKKKTSEWRVRLLEDIKQHKNGKFVTLTFSNESIKKLIDENKELQLLKGYELDNGIATKAVHLFRERYRKKFDKSIRHWLITELGHNGTENIHLHGIIWTNESRETIANIWNYGYIWPRYDKDWNKNYVNAQTINYITKYITKQDLDHKYYKPKILTSPGIGGNYTNNREHTRNKFNLTNTIETYKTSTGHEIAMPIYWRNKIYTDNEREQLWLQRLDKNERFICGEKIPADDYENYYRLLNWHRERNKKLGYGNYEIDWDRKSYEENRRELLFLQRIKEKTSLCITGHTTN